MKRSMKYLCAVLALCVMIPVIISGAAVITPWENIYDESPAMYIDWYVKDGEKVWDRIIWNERDFADMFENIPSYEYTDSRGYWSGVHGRYSVSIDTSYDVNVADAVYDENSLTFDYTASIDLAPDADGKTTYHGLFVLFYKAVSDAEGYYGESNGYFDGVMDGYRIVKYVAPGTVDGQAEIESGENVTVVLPENFDPAKHVIGYAVWRIEDKDIVYKYDNPDMQEFPYIADPGTDSTPVKLFDLSEYITEPESTPAPEPEPEPEPTPEPEPLMGDANGDGVLDLADVSFALKYIAEWDVIPDAALADMNGNGRVGLEDVSAMLKLIAGWDV